MDNINIIDMALAVIIVLSSAIGLWRGLIRGVFGIISLVLAFFTAQKYGGALAHSLGWLLGKSAVTAVVGYALAFIMSLMIFSALTHLLRKSADKADLGMMDKFGGLLFGVLRGGVISLLVVFILSAMPVHGHAVWRDSLLLPLFGATLKTSINLLDDKTYKRYWRFDEQNRPRLILPDLELLDLEDVAATAQQRDDLLDSINDEGRRQDQHINKELYGEDGAPKERSLSAIQEVRQEMDGLGDKIAKHEKQQRRKELQPTPLSEMSGPVPKSFWGKVKKQVRELFSDTDKKCNGESCAVAGQ